MRLLNTKTLQFAEFFEADLPPYAILSHRWGKDEVSFRDFRKGLLREGKGFEKILKCCEIAAAQSLEWAWVDTCCIDKRSSAELSEAINSMFQWYANARICFAFLADVHPLAISTTARDESFAFSAVVPFDENEFRASTWFTRGWTLQELLAPSTVIFFISTYQPIGEKAGWLDIVQDAYEPVIEVTPPLNHLICDITGIPPRYVGCHASVIATATVGERMRWASRRQTTRVEDIAYCLLGIFDVNMPLLYGEGMKAFIRLQVEIMNRSDDESLFAWTNKSTMMFGVDDILASSPQHCCFIANTAMSEYFRDLYQARQPLAVTSRGLSLRTAVLYNVPILYVLNVRSNFLCEGSTPRLPPFAILLQTMGKGWARFGTGLFFGRHLLIHDMTEGFDATSYKHISDESGESFETACSVYETGALDQEAWAYVEVTQQPGYLVHFSDEVFDAFQGDEIVVCQPNDICTYIKMAGAKWHPHAVGRKISDRTMILDRSLHQRIYINQRQRW